MSTTVHNVDKLCRVVYKKFGVRSRMELVHVVHKLGLLDTETEGG